MDKTFYTLHHLKFPKSELHASVVLRTRFCEDGVSITPVLGFPYSVDMSTVTLRSGTYPWFEDFIIAAYGLKTVNAVMDEFEKHELIGSLMGSVWETVK